MFFQCMELKSKPWKYYDHVFQLTYLGYARQAGGERQSRQGLFPIAQLTAYPKLSSRFMGNCSVRAKIYRDSILPSHPFLHLPQVGAVQVKALPPAQAGDITEELWLSIFSLTNIPQSKMLGTNP